MPTRSPRRWWFLWTIAALGAAAVCVSFLAEAKRAEGKAPAPAAEGKAPAPTNEGKAPAPTAEGKAPAPAAGCKVDKDCVLVVDGCCSCTEGGKQRAISRKQSKSYEADRQKRCAGTACMQMMSTDPSCNAHALCKAGACVLAPAAGGDAPPPR